MLVELACSTTLVPAYHAPLFKKMTGSVLERDEQNPLTVVFIVCGGFKVDLKTAMDYEDLMEKALGPEWNVGINGELFSFEK